MARSWYSYDGTGDPTLPSNYILAGATPACETGANLCAIYAYGGGPQPTSPLSPNIRRYIGAALVTFVPQPELPVGSKKFVYLKVSS